MQYDTRKYSVFYHRYHVVWIAKYRYKVFQGRIQQCVCQFVRQVCNELGVEMIRGVLSSDHAHILSSNPDKYFSE